MSLARTIRLVADSCIYCFGERVKDLIHITDLSCAHNPVLMTVSAAFLIYSGVMPLIKTYVTCFTPSPRR